jgi:hypothetical protein
VRETKLFILKSRLFPKARSRSLLTFSKKPGFSLEPLGVRKNFLKKPGFSKSANQRNRVSFLRLLVLVPVLVKKPGFSKSAIGPPNIEVNPAPCPLGASVAPQKEKQGLNTPGIFPCATKKIYVRLGFKGKIVKFVSNCKKELKFWNRSSIMPTDLVAVTTHPSANRGGK